MTLDDFIMNDNIPWKRIVIVFVSSFGAGGPPSGSIKFRRLCESWLDHSKKNNDTDPTHFNKNDGNDSNNLLSGIRFSMCGYGDSFYKTYMKNPNTIVAAMQQVGASLIGIQGKIDCNLDHTEEQIQEQFTDWITKFWDPFDDVIDDLLEQYKTNQWSITKEKLESIKRSTSHQIE
jgi:sulfite reductase alpha subunit-like flavoprotein